MYDNEYLVFTLISANVAKICSKLVWQTEYSEIHIAVLLSSMFPNSQPIVLFSFGTLNLKKSLHYSIKSTCAK